MGEDGSAVVPDPSVRRCLGPSHSVDAVADLHDEQSFLIVWRGSEGPDP